MIIVTGAAGKLGADVVARLLDRVPATDVGVSVRDPRRAAALTALGVRVRHGDFDDPATLDHAFEGATRVLVVSVDATGDQALRRHRTAFEAAAKAGAEHILYTSHMGANPASPFAPMPDHAATEAALLDVGVPFTSLRNGFYTASGLMLLGKALETGVLAAPEDGPVSWTAHADLAEAAALTLAGATTLTGATPPLTALEAVDLAGVARIASEVTGRPVRRVVISDDEYRAGLVDHGVPAPAADMLVGLFEASRNGEFAAVDPTLAELLGRKPLTVQELLAA